MNCLLRCLLVALILALSIPAAGAMELETIAMRSGLSSWMNRTLPSDFIHCLAVDAYDTSAVYIGTEQGLVWTDGRRFRWYGTGSLEGPPCVGINEILQFRYYVVVATDRGISIFNYTTLTWDHLDQDSGLPGNCVQSLARVDDVHLLLGTWGHGVVSFNILDRTIAPVVIPGFSGRFITDMLVDKDLGKVLVASLDAGLAIRQNKAWTLMSVDSGKFPADRVNALAGDGSRFYAGTPRGLVEVVGGTVRIITRLDGLTSDNILSLWADGYDVWAGTDEGISHLYDGKITAFPVKNSLSRGRPVRVTAVLKADSGLWFGTQHAGLLHRDRTF